MSERNACFCPEWWTLPKDLTEDNSLQPYETRQFVPIVPHHVWPKISHADWSVYQHYLIWIKLCCPLAPSSAKWWVHRMSKCCSMTTNNVFCVHAHFYILFTSVNVMEMYKCQRRDFYFGHLIMFDIKDSLQNLKRNVMHKLARQYSKILHAQLTCQ